MPDMAQSIWRSSAFLAAGAAPGRLCRLLDCRLCEPGSFCSRWWAQLSHSRAGECSARSCVYRSMAQGGVAAGFPDRHRRRRRSWLGGHRHWRTGPPRAPAHVARHPDPHIGGAKPSHPNSDRRDGNARQFLDRQPRSKAGCAAEHRHYAGIGRGCVRRACGARGFPRPGRRRRTGSWSAHSSSCASGHALVTAW